MDKKIIELIQHIDPFYALEKLEKLGYIVEEFLFNEIQEGYKTNSIYLPDLLALIDFLDEEKKEKVEVLLSKIPEYREELEETEKARKKNEIDFKYKQNIDEPVVPSFLFGKYGDVKKECRKVATKLKRGMSLDEIIENHYEYLKISDLTGKLVLDGPNPLLGSDEHLNLFAFPRVLNDKIFSGELSIEFIFDSMIDTFWGHLCLSCGQNVYNYYKTEDHQIRYLKSLFRFHREYIHISPKVEEYPFQISRMFLSEENKKCPPLVFDAVSFIARYVLSRFKKFPPLEVDKKSLTFLQYCQQVEVESYLNINFEYAPETISAV